MNLSTHIILSNFSFFLPGADYGQDNLLNK